MTLLLCITVRQIGTSMVIQNTLTGNDDKLVPVFNSLQCMMIEVEEASR